MSASLNKAQVIGNLGSDPKVRSTSGGIHVATLSVATSRRWTDDHGQDQERTEWHRVIAWDRLAEIVERYLSKGDRIYVEGRIQYREWEDDDGRTRYSTEIVARRLLMLGSPDGRRTRQETEPRDSRPSEPETSQEEIPAEMGGESDLPF